MYAFSSYILPTPHDTPFRLPFRHHFHTPFRHPSNSLLFRLPPYPPRRLEAP
jgi:hypothetical protein